MTLPAENAGILRTSPMTALLDVDQLRTFIAIAETGSFTKAAEVVNKTQSAVSMQMKRLEERLDRPIFARDGRASKLTEDGQRLLDYARRIVKLNVETIAAFSDAELSGRVRLGVPDDYADRYLPEIMARFSRAYPGVELTVICEPSVDLLERIDANEIDLAIVTNCETKRASETFRRERLLWVTSNRHSTHTEERLPLALGRPTCSWRRIAIERLEIGGAALSRALFELERRRGRRRRARRIVGVGAAEVRTCGPACACSPPPKDFPNCRVAASAWCATRMKARRWPTRSPSTSCRRSITCRKRRRRSSRLIRSTRRKSVDRACLHDAVEFLQQFLRRRDAARDALFERAQIARLVAAVAVEMLAARQAARGEPQRLLRQRQHVAVADFGPEAAHRHVVAQFLALLARSSL